MPVSPPSRHAPDAIGRYRLAIRREAELSSFWGRYLGLDGRLLAIPNGFAHRRFVLRFAPMLRLFLPVAGVLWAFIGMPLYALVWALRWTVAAGWDAPEVLPPSFYLQASNDRNLAYVPSAAGRPTVVLSLPWWTGAQPGAWAARCIDLRRLSSRGAVWRAAWSSACAGLQILMSEDRGKVLFTYSAPAWMWLHEALAAAGPTQIWISNHVDRWASLVTSLPEAQVVMVQHGDLGHWDSRQDTRLVPALTELLPRVRRVFVTDAESIGDFIAAITGPGPEFAQIELGMRVTPWPVPEADVKRVMMIGHPDAQGAISAVIRDLDARGEGRLLFAYRPHPTESRPVALPLAGAVRIEFTESGDTVPAVDIVVSYGSSVTGEIISATGAALVRWDPNDPASITTTIDAVLAAAGNGAAVAIDLRG